MVAIDIGRVCKKLTGREAGRYCVVVDMAKEEGYVEVTGPRDVSNVRRRQCNILHLEPTDDVLDIKKGAPDGDVKKAMEKAGLLEKVTVTQVKKPAPKKETKGKAKKVETKKVETEKVETEKAETKTSPAAKKPAAKK
jgi:large subunit ribosomal protein L14e